MSSTPSASTSWPRTSSSRRAHAADKAAFIGSFYGSFFFWVNVTAALVQAFLVSRLVKRTGVRGVLLFFPLLAFGVYAMMAAGVSFAVIRWLKTADNATDYSVMNTGRAMLWLPTSREEKYRAKQAMDTFVVRFGDVLATAVVFTATALLHLGPSALAAMNVIAAVVWIFVAAAVARQNGASQARAMELAAAAAPRLRVAHDARARCAATPWSPSSCSSASSAANSCSRPRATRSS